MTSSQQPPPRNILALDTAHSLVAACLLTGSDVYHAGAGAEKPRSISLASTLTSLLEKAGLQWHDLDAFAFGCGPGSFTGLRIGAATLAGLNSGLNRPMLHISSLAITAAQADTSDAITVIEDARAGEAFIACHQAGKALRPDRCLPWQEVAAMPSAAYASHTEPAIDLPAWQRLPLQLSRDQALARTVGHAAGQITDWQALPRYPQPAYLQPSQAERNAHV